ncbi:MAG TPA: SEC-C metal-binding domain-containing protein [Thermoanaerobaculia bacterium]|nr:SEC-C metal-binding domain-containing protein [Thermoanaerobaculia bacterium]
MQTGRNERCPCGGGAKFKNCCAKKVAARDSRGIVILLAAIAAVAALGIVPAFLKDEKTATPAAPIAAPARTPDRPGSPQPGPAPAGKVWSVEHGHWHDATPPSSAVQVSPIQTSRGNLTPSVTPNPPRPVPQPAGEAPAGKVWSPEHGHWHDKAPGQ